MIGLRHLMGSRSVKNRLLLRKDNFFRIQKGEGGNPEFSAALYKNVQICKIKKNTFWPTPLSHDNRLHVHQFVIKYYMLFIYIFIYQVGKGVNKKPRKMCFRDVTVCPRSLDQYSIL